MSSPFELGVILDDPRALDHARTSDPLTWLVFRNTLANMPRVAAAQRLGERACLAHPEAKIALYGWHYLTHVRSDGFAARASRKLGESEFGHLRECAGVEQAWSVTQAAAEAAGASAVVLRTPPSFSTGQLSRQRLANFVSAHRAELEQFFWAPEGLWTDVDAAAVGADCGVEVLVSSRHDRAAEVSPAVWLRIDGELRPSFADQLAYELEAREAPVRVWFSGPQAHANLRRFARALAFDD